MLASGGCWDGRIGWWCLCLWLCRLRRLWELQCRRQGCRREAGRGQPAGELRGRRVQAGGVLHWGSRGRVVLLLVRLLSCELGGLGGRRHPSLHCRHQLLERNARIHPWVLENYPLVTDFKSRSLRLLCRGSRLLSPKGVRFYGTSSPCHQAPCEALLKWLLLG